jgi:uncharacterized protein
MVIGRLSDGVLRGVDRVADTLSETFLEQRLRLGVTGLSQAGKTVFITSLVANLLDRARMGRLQGVGGWPNRGRFPATPAR